MTVLLQASYRGSKERQLLRTFEKTTLPGGFFVSRLRYALKWLAVKKSGFLLSSRLVKKNIIFQETFLLTSYFSIHHEKDKWASTPDSPIRKQENLWKRQHRS